MSLFLAGFLSGDDFGQYLAKLYACYEHLPEEQQSVIKSWFATFPKEDFLYIVDNLKNVVSIYMLQDDNNSGLKPFLQFLGILHSANEQAHCVSSEDFYIETITQETDVEEQIQIRMRNKKFNESTFSFIDYPWVLDCGFKAGILDYESKIERERDLVNSYMGLMSNFGALLGGGGAADLIYLKLEVRREHLIEDTLNRLSTPDLNFKKTLKVTQRLVYAC